MNKIEYRTNLCINCLFNHYNCFLKALWTNLNTCGQYSIEEEKKNPLSLPVKLIIVANFIYKQFLYHEEITPLIHYSNPSE